MTQPDPVPFLEKTAKEIRDHLIAGDDVWILADSRRHRILDVEVLTPEQAALGKDFGIIFRGAVSGLTLVLQVNHAALVRVMVSDQKTSQA